MFTVSNISGVEFCKCPVEGSIHPFSMLSEILQRRQMSLIEEGHPHASENGHTALTSLETYVSLEVHCISDW